MFKNALSIFTFSVVFIELELREKVLDDRLLLSVGITMYLPLS